ncbi:rab-GTPase-TBC domain-containing protein, partial [Thamnocephalis sphaerospora]
YVQKMHRLARPFVEVLPESEAFAGFTLFMTQHAPSYARVAQDGIQCAVELFDECLRALDRPLYNHLLDCGVHPEQYAYEPLLGCTTCMTTVDYEQWLRRWDIFLAYGIHMNILFMIAQLMSARYTLLASDCPMNILGAELVADVNEIIQCAITLSRRLPPALYGALAQHITDVTAVLDKLPLVL